ncbi:MAG: hypothetical protein IPG00_01305 [Saprospiraceae bacterium]|nr:hypothetical protein [Saprospiraceae bacterium]
MTKIQISALDEIFHTSSAKMPLSQSITFNHSMTLLQNLENDPKMPFGLYGKLFLLKNEIQTNKLTEFGFAHGDFTPWNIFIDTWNAALDTLTGTTSHRQAFINSLFDHLYPMEYAGLKVGDNHPSFWSEESDIDILTKKKNFIRITQFCKNSPLTSDVVITSKSFMKNVAIYFHDGSFLSLDMIHQLKRKKYIFLNADKLLKRSMVNPYGIKILSHLDDARYIAWFYALNNSKIPTKYENIKIFIGVI